MDAPGRDRVGLGWRAPLAAALYAHLDQLDVIEVLADGFFEAGRRQLASLRALGREVPLLCHGVGLGLASVTPVESRRLEPLARVVGALEPAGWSEHLAFVRAGGHEIGHLAAPARNPRTVEGASRNLARVRQVVGGTPALENIATLIDPPFSSLTEMEWISAILADSGSPMLLDLHNLHANCLNFGQDAGTSLQALPLTRVAQVHLSGGVMLEKTFPAHGLSARRLLDDHCHDVPEPVYALLTDLAARCPQPLTVIIERDGRYPGMPALLAQVEQARQALRAGRQARREAA